MTWLREQKLLHLIGLLWDALPSGKQQELESAAVKLGMGWALPDNDDDYEWLTTAQVAEEFNLSVSSIRTNWPRQYAIRPQNDRWRRTDVDLVRLKRQLKGKVA